MWFSLLLFALLAASLLLNVAFGFRGLRKTFVTTHSRHLDDNLNEEVVDDNGSNHKIAVIRIEGVIGSQSVEPGGSTEVELVRDQLDRAAADTSVKAVILKVDSPGGEVLASDEIYQLIRDFQRKPNGKPVVASMGNLAASGGYYVSAPCRWIVANELTLTGSIGVIMHGLNYRGLMDKVGVRPQVFKSGRFKDMLSGTKTPEEETAEEKAMVQEMVMETYGKFRSVVEEGRAWSASQNAGATDEKDRGRKLIRDWGDYADGRILSGKSAYEKGFVDELGNFNTAVSRAQELAGIEDSNLIEYRLPFRFGGLLRLLGQTSARGVKIDLGFDVPRLAAGRLYFLAPTFFN